MGSQNWLPLSCNVNDRAGSSCASVPDTPRSIAASRGEVHRRVRALAWQPVAQERPAQLYVADRVPEVGGHRRVELGQRPGVAELEGFECVEQRD